MVQFHERYHCYAPRQPLSAILWHSVSEFHLHWAEWWSKRIAGVPRGLRRAVWSSSWRREEFCLALYRTQIPLALYYKTCLIRYYEMLLQTWQGATHATFEWRYIIGFKASIVPSQWLRGWELQIRYWDSDKICEPKKLWQETASLPVCSELQKNRYSAPSANDVHIRPITQQRVSINSLYAFD